MKTLAVILNKISREINNKLPTAMNEVLQNYKEYYRPKVKILQLGLK